MASCTIRINRIKKNISVEAEMSFTFDEFAKEVAAMRKKIKTNLWFYGFALAFENSILDYAYAAFTDVEVEEKHFDEKAELFDILDNDDKTAIYRLLAKKYHPDAGGNDEMMAFINRKFGK
jgi:hypothetical protein